MRTHWGPEWGWVCDKFCTHDGYEDGDRDKSNMIEMGLGCYNLVGNSPLTSLVRCHRGKGSAAATGAVIVVSVWQLDADE
jgi:hypothetical protein